VVVCAEKKNRKLFKIQTKMDFDFLTERKSANCFAIASFERKKEREKDCKIYFPLI